MNKLILVGVLVLGLAELSSGCCGLFSHKKIRKASCCVLGEDNANVVGIFEWIRGGGTVSVCVFTCKKKKKGLDKCRMRGKKEEGCEVVETEEAANQPGGAIPDEITDDMTLQELYDALVSINIELESTEITEERRAELVELKAAAEARIAVLEAEEGVTSIEESIQSATTIEEIQLIISRLRIKLSDPNLSDEDRAKYEELLAGCEQQLVELELKQNEDGIPSDINDSLTLDVLYEIVVKITTELQSTTITEERRIELQELLEKTELRITVLEEEAGISGSIEENISDTMSIEDVRVIISRIQLELLNPDISAEDKAKYEALLAECEARLVTLELQGGEGGIPSDISDSMTIENLYEVLFKITLELSSTEITEVRRNELLELQTKATERIEVLETEAGGSVTIQESISETMTIEEVRTVISRIQLKLLEELSEEERKEYVDLLAECQGRLVELEAEVGIVGLPDFVTETMTLQELYSILQEASVTLANVEITISEEQRTKLERLVASATERIEILEAEAGGSVTIEESINDEMSIEEIRIVVSRIQLKLLDTTISAEERAQYEQLLIDCEVRLVELEREESEDDLPSDITDSMSLEELYDIVYKATVLSGSIEITPERLLWILELIQKANVRITVLESENSVGTIQESISDTMTIEEVQAVINRLQIALLDDSLEASVRTEYEGLLAECEARLVELEAEGSGGVVLDGN